MRDLSARLREIVRRETSAAASRVPDSTHVVPFVDEPPSGNWGARAAAELGGTLHDVGGSACIVIDRLWEADRWHGRGRVSSLALDPQAPIGLFDPRIGAAPDWARRPVFFDIETTGLGGGAGTVAFLVGCGWFDADGFRVRQFFLPALSGEHAMLDAIAELFGGASLLVTFNGRTFDVPLMDMRWAFHRRPSPAEALPHFDMLPPARRLWSGRGEPDADRSCSLSSLERSILGFHRVADVPGFEIPGRYFHFLRTGDAGAIAGVLEHNQHDLLSLAAIVSYALALAREGPEGSRDPMEQLALGRLYERADEPARAARAYALAAEAGSVHARGPALARLATMMRRENRFDEAAAAWQGVLDLASGQRRPLTAIERHAAEALAIHHEHRARDLTAARRYAEALRGQVSGRSAADVEHRLGRLQRKMESQSSVLSPRSPVSPQSSVLGPLDRDLTED
jgi:hypothetical protein